jgi:tetratricopeptide (TPR) repeat protein
LATLLTIALSHPASAAAQQTAPDPCAAADALRKAGEVEQARKKYVSLLSRNPTTSCAIEGLEAINAPAPKPPSCEPGDEKMEAGDLEGARIAYEALGQDSKCGAAGLTAVKEIQRLCDEGKAYESLHRDDDALSAFESALAKNPKAECARAGVEEATPGEFSRDLTLVSDAIPEALVILGILLVLLFLVLLLGYWEPTRHIPARLPIAGRILSPRLTLEPLNDEALGDNRVGLAIVTRIKERLQRFRQEALGTEVADYDLDLGSADEEFAEMVSSDAGLENALGKVRDLSQHTMVVAALVDLLYAMLPIRRLKISGVLDPPAPSGAAATLGLESGARLCAAVKLTGPQLGADPTPSDYLRLADPAAVWTQYAVARALGGKHVDPDAAESYALVREGLDRHIEGNEPLARIAYEQALALNPRNWAALVNLAVTEARLAKDYVLAIDILTDALAEMERTTP